MMNLPVLLCTMVLQQVLQQFHIGCRQPEIGAVGFFFGCFYGQLDNGSFRQGMFAYGLKKQGEFGMVLPEGCQHFLELHQLKWIDCHANTFFPER